MDTLGTTVTIHPEGRITVVSKNKNEESILQTGTMKYPRYPAFDSYMPHAVKVGTVKGQICRMVRDTSENAYSLLRKPIWIFILELKERYYPWGNIYRILRRIDVNSLPVKQKGAKDFLAMWKQVLSELARVAKHPRHKHVICVD